MEAVKPGLPLPHQTE